MGHPRRTGKVSGRRPRKHAGPAPRDKYGRDRAAEFAKRDKQARAWGFRSYWDQRQRGDWASLLRYIRPGDIVMLERHVGDHKRNGLGEWERIEKIVHPDDPRRSEKRFVLRNISDRQLARLIDEELMRGANMSMIPSLDQQRLLRKGTDAAA